MDVNKNVSNNEKSIEGLVDVDKNEMKRYNVKPNDLFFTRTSETSEEIGLTSSYTGELIDCVFSGFILRARPIKKDINSLFFAYYLRSDKSRNNIIKYSSITTRALISGSNLYKMKIRMPDLNEQNKIASFLSAIDKKIELLEKKYENTLKIKNSIAQNLLNGTYVFDNSKNEWEEVNLSSILKERKEYAEKNSGFPHVTLSKDGILPKTDEYNREFLVKDENKKYKVTHLNDICYNPANLKFGVITLNKFGSAIFSPIYVTFEVLNANTEFIAYSLIRNNFINKIRKYEEGTVYERMAVKPSDFLKGKILIPSLEYQEKISNFLNQIDLKIEKYIQEIEFIKSFKKALLQKMFV